MSLNGKKISEFKLNAFQQNDFIEVTDRDLLGKWSVLFFYPADFTLCARPSLKTCRASMLTSRESDVKFILFPVIPTLFTKHGMNRLRQSARLSIR